MVAEDSEVNTVTATQDCMTEEAVAAPLAMWESEIQNIELEKGEAGLGFSILDYQVGILQENLVFMSFLCPFFIHFG